MTNRPTVSVDWLQEHLQDENLRVLDASWHLPAAGRDAHAEYLQAHIPGAVFFDIDQHSRTSHLPHMMPSDKQFAQAVAQLGVSNTHTIVVYDSVGLFSAARLWWMFRHFGAARVYVLDGGLPVWTRAGYPVDKGQVILASAQFEVAASDYVIATADDVLHASHSGERLVLDARSEARFLGIEKEVREGLRSGHVPGSKNMPFAELLVEGQLKSDEELRRLLQLRGVSSETSIITSCGSGVTAAVICLALESIGSRDVALYDGSWSEWGAREDLPVVTQ